MGLASQYAVMCLWSAVCVRAQDPPSLNSNSNTNPLCFLIGDGPYNKCVDVDTNPTSSSAVTKSDPTTVSTTVINPTSTTVESSTTKPKPATITPTVYPSPMIVDETVHKTQEDGQNRTGSLSCGSAWMGINTEVYLLVVCGVLILIMVTLSFCLYKQSKKQPVENLHLTRLISIPNPAFYNP